MGYSLPQPMLQLLPPLCRMLPRIPPLSEKQRQCPVRQPRRQASHSGAVLASRRQFLWLREQQMLRWLALRTASPHLLPEALILYRVRAVSLLLLPGWRRHQLLPNWLQQYPPLLRNWLRQYLPPRLQGSLPGHSKWSGRPMPEQVGLNCLVR